MEQYNQLLNLHVTFFYSYIHLFSSDENSLSMNWMVLGKQINRIQPVISLDIVRGFYFPHLNSNQSGVIRDDGIINLTANLLCLFLFVFESEGISL